MSPVAGLPPGGFRLDGKTALVTGGSRNIGASMAKAFAEAGANVVITARDGARLEAVRAELAAAHPEVRITGVVSDVGRADDVDRIAEHVAAEFGLLDVLVNNAAAVGDTDSMPVLEIGDEVWDQVLAANLLGPFRLIRALVAPMVASGRGGSVINVLSGAGFLPVRTMTPYGTTKAALWMLTRYLAVELAPLVRVNAITPGMVKEDGEWSERAPKSLKDSVPFGRCGRPEEVAGAAVYLASPAASFTSGEVIFCNGARAW